MARYQCGIVQIQIKAKNQCKVLCIENAPVFSPHLKYTYKKLKSLGFQANLLEEAVIFISKYIYSALTTDEPFSTTLST